MLYDLNGLRAVNKIVFNWVSNWVVIATTIIAVETDCNFVTLAIYFTSLVICGHVWKLNLAVFVDYFANE